MVTWDNVLEDIIINCIQNNNFNLLEEVILNCGGL